MNGYFNYKDELYHHGVLGMKWGVRRYQSYSENPKLSNRQKKRLAKDAKRAFNKNKVSTIGLIKGKKSRSFGKNTDEVIKRYKEEANNNPYEKKLNEMDKKAAELNKKYKGQDSEAIRKMKQDFNKEYYENVRKNTEYGEKVAEKYVKDLNVALVKDLDIPHAEDVGNYITDNMSLWDKTYINNYAWFGSLH